MHDAFQNIFNFQQGAGIDNDTAERRSDSAAVCLAAAQRLNCIQARSEIKKNFIQRMIKFINFR